jgi:hypothetical protein
MVARRPYANQSTLDNLDALVILFAGLYTYLLAGKTTPLKHWTSSFLQACHMRRLLTVTLTLFKYRSQRYSSFKI